MANTGGILKERVRAAKAWLGKAERSLEQENTVKGNLHLLLAQAELKRAREAEHAVWSWRRCRSLLIHSMLVVGIVAAAIFAGFGGGRPAERESALAPAALQPITRRETKAQTAKEEDAAQAILPQAEPPQGQAASKREEHTVAAPRVQTEVHVPPPEMQLLLRAAGKSLRGEATIRN